MKIIIKVLILFALILSVSSAFNQAQKDEILKAHNDYRSKEGAANMLKMSWDDAIEANAQKYADGPKSGHSGDKGYGENLYMSSGSGVNPTGCVKSWFDEKTLFSWPADPVLTSAAFNAQTGHYTQVVWAASSQLGCGQAKKGQWDNWIICQYKSAGNMTGSNLWLSGEPCSKCPATWDKKCEEKMCAGGTTPGGNTNSPAGAGGAAPAGAGGDSPTPQPEEQEMTKPIQKSMEQPDLPTKKFEPEPEKPNVGKPMTAELPKPKKNKLKDKVGKKIIFPENGLSNVSLSLATAKRFVSEQVMPDVFTIQIKIINLSPGKKFMVGFVKTQSKKKIPNDVKLTQWYCSSSSDPTDNNDKTEDPPNLKTGDIVTLFGKNGKVGFKVNDTTYNMSNTFELTSGYFLRLSIRLFEKGDKAEVINYTTTETPFAKEGDKNSPKPMFVKQIGDQKPQVTNSKGCNSGKK